MMRYQKWFLIIMITLCSLFLLSGCGFNTMKDGFYTAEAAEFSHGWKEYVCILVKDNKIVSVEYNAVDLSGFVKAWDNEYMRTMNSIAGSYPNAYTRAYGKQLIEKQSADNIDAVSGATHSGSLFQQLAKAAIEQAKRGDETKIIVSEEE